MLVFVLLMGLLRVSKIMHGCGGRSGLGYEIASRGFHRAYLSTICR
jgi:hypothetical protein